MNLVLAARREEALRQVAARVEALGSRAFVQPADVTDEAQCRVLIQRAIEGFGRIDLLILNAGVGLWARLDEVSELSAFRKLIETNYLGAVYCIHPALLHLRESRGTIVAILSLQAVVGVTLHTGYAASKHALKGFLDALEMEVGDEVHILRVLPGWIRGTDLRADAFKAEGARETSAHKRGRHSVGLEECASAVVRAIRAERRTLYLPGRLRFLPWLALLAPSLLKRLVRRAVEKQED